MAVSGATTAAAPGWLQIGLLGQEQSITDFYAEVTDGAFQLGVPQQQLAGTKVAGALVHQGNFRPPQTVRRGFSGGLGPMIRPVFQTGR